MDIESLTLAELKEKYKSDRKKYTDKGSKDVRTQAILTGLNTRIQRLENDNGGESNNE